MSSTIFVVLLSLLDNIFTSRSGRAKRQTSSLKKFNWVELTVGKLFFIRRFKNEKSINSMNCLTRSFQIFWLMLAHEPLDISDLLGKCEMWGTRYMFSSDMLSKIILKNMYTLINILLSYVTCTNLEKIL